MGLLIARSVRRGLISGLVCLYIFVVAVHVSQAQPINALIVFGDSLSDSGNLYTYTGTAFPPSPPYDPGHFSNGRVWAEVLADALFLGGLTPSLLGGTNYSWGGAETGFGLSSQGTPNLGEQVKAYLMGKVPTGGELFVLWAGSNDVNNATSPPNPFVMAQNVAGHIQTLVAAAPGVRLRFLVVNVPPLGDTPRVQWLSQFMPSLPSQVDALVRGYNAILAQTLASLQTQLNAEITLFDIYLLGKKVSSYPEDFGFTNTTGTARIGTKPDGSPVDVTWPGTGVVPNPDEYVFFDDVHPTRAWHRVVGTEAVALVAEPVAMDLKPGSDPNCVNVTSRGVVPVAIYGGVVDVRDIETTTLKLAGLHVAVRENGAPQCSYEYLNADPIVDLVCKFETSAGNWYAVDHTALLTGQLLDGTAIFGTDAVCLVP